jgi:ABC-type bacteriocin/lantibiotic exporter with double-glycine peptidase domain
LSIFIQKKQINFGLYVGQKFTYHEFELLTRLNLLNIKKLKSTIAERNIVTIPYFLVNFIIQPTILITTEILVLLVILFSLVIYDWKIVTLIFLTVFPPFIFAYFFSRNKIEYYSRKIIDLTPKVNQWVYQSFFGFVDMKILGKEDYFINNFKSNFSKKNYYFGWQSLFKNIPVKIVEISIVFMLIIVIIYGFFFVNDKNSFSIFLTIFSVSLFRIIPLTNRLIQSMLLLKGYQYVFEIINPLKTKIQNQSSIESPSEFTSLSLNSISFNYEKENIINNLSIEINRGDFVGIAGESGSGKTTLINIILGFFKPKNGDIFFNGKKMNDIKSLQNIVGYVQQDVYIMDGTIKENILFGSENHDEEKLCSICLKVNLLDFVNSLENKFDTKIGELGSLISGGQKQRIGIARAIYNNRKILILDESTNSLDHKTEEEIFKLLKELNNNGLTLIVIAHNHKLFKNCNKIIELKDNNNRIISKN